MVDEIWVKYIIADLFLSVYTVQNRLEPPTKPKLTWKTAIFPLLGLVGFFLYIYLFKVDILGIIETAKTADPLIYAVAILFGLLEVFFFTFLGGY